MRLLIRFMLLGLWSFLGLVGISLLVIALATPRLPEVTALADYRPKVPLRVLTADGVLIGEFGEERRSVVRISEVPKSLIHAILAAEDDQFYQHAGIDPAGILRSVFANLLAGSKAQGASTITMQVARNFYLSTEKTFTRKIYEVLLAFEIERKLTKDQILELYINQIYLGRRAYGFASAAQIYFGKPIGRLSIAESAMLAGLPKAPSSYNPVANPRRAQARQQYILGRMQKLRLISNAQFNQASREELKVVSRGEDYAVSAPYLAEMVRQQIVAQFPDDAYSRGLTVFTTIRANEQKAAQNAMRSGLIEFDRRQGWRGPEAFVTLPKNGPELEDLVEDTLADRPDSDGLLTAVVIEVKEGSVRVMRAQGKTFDIQGDGLKFASKGLSASALPALKIRPGAVVRIQRLDAERWEISQIPEVEGAFVAIQTDTGALRALVGGFDFRQNKFNHVTQAYRQPGSTIKPFVYSAALEKGFSASSIVNDAPVNFDPGQTGGQVWDPKNYDGTYEGPITLRDALAKSKNMVSIRLLHAVGPKYAQNYLSRFGFEAQRNPPYLTLALGAGSVTPLQMATAYAAFANGGFRVTPYFIDRVVDERGALVSRTEPAKAGDEAPRVLDERYAYLMHNLLQGVVKNGTGRKALQLGRTDLAGKTGTTNDAQDAWFAGYQPKLAGVAWVGYDQPRTLGERETGGGLALPIWMSFMAEALKKIPQQAVNPPAGMLKIGNEYYVPDNAPGVGVPSLGVNNP
jgi:penicillin-binding protein 1A